MARGRQASGRWCGPLLGGTPPELTLVPLQEELVEPVRDGLLVLWAIGGLVLLVGCASLASLVLARAGLREREMAIRSALGARRFHLARQLLLESVLLSLAGGAVGLLLAVAVVRFLPALAPGDIPLVEQVRIDGAVLGFALLASLLTAFFFGALPALLGSRAEAISALRSGGGLAGSRTSTAGGKLSGALVVVEIALALVVLVGAGLLTRSLAALVAIDPGYDAAEVLTARFQRGAGRDGLVTPVDEEDELELDWDQKSPPTPLEEPQSNSFFDHPASG